MRPDKRRALPSPRHSFLLVNMHEDDGVTENKSFILNQAWSFGVPCCACITSYPPAPQMLLFWPRAACAGQTIPLPKPQEESHLCDDALDHEKPL